jgi:DNA repair exonuclease SbcCD ATPase subunit
MRAARKGLEERMRGLEDQRDQFDDAFDDEIEQKRRELDDLIEVLREESMQPLEEKSVALDEELEVRWAALEVLYEEQAGLTDQMKELEVRIRDLDRQAEFGVLNVLTGALENVAELEKSGGVGSFDSFIPGVGGDQGFSPNDQGFSPNDQGSSPNDQGSSPTAP